MTTPVEYQSLAAGAPRPLRPIALIVVGLLLTFGVYYTINLSFDVLSLVGLRFYFINWTFRILFSIVGMLIAASLVAATAHWYRAPKHVFYGAGAAVAIHLGYAGMKLAMSVVAWMMGRPVWFY